MGPIPLTLKQATFQLVANTAATASNVTTLMWLQPTPSQGLMPSTFPVTANSALWTGSKATRLNITAAGRTNITYNLGGVVIPSGYYVRCPHRARVLEVSTLTDLRQVSCAAT